MPTTLVKSKWSSGVLVFEQKSSSGAIHFGVSDTGLDVKFWGATPSNYMLWDESADSLVFSGTAVTQAMGSNANTSGSGTKLTVSKTGALKVYADDGGVALTPSGSVPDVRTVLGRMLIAGNQSAVHARAWGVMGNLRVYDALFSEEQAGGVVGRLELVQSAGTTTLAGNGITAGVTGVLATAGTVLINTNHISAAVAAIADIKGTVTQTGKAVGVLVAPYDTTNWSDATSRAKFGYGIFVDQNAASRGIYVGLLGSDTTSGMPMGGATTLNGFFADDSGAAQTASTVWRNVTARTYYSITQSNVAADAYVIRAHLKAASGVNFTGDTSVRAASNSYVELAGDTTVGAGSFFAGHFAELWSDGNFTGTGKAAGVMSRIMFAATKTASGTTAAFMATKHFASNDEWPYGLYIDSATIDIRLGGGPCILSGTGDPNGNSAFTAPKGSIFLRSDNSSHDDTVYCNTNGTTGWAAIVSG